MKRCPQCQFIYLDQDEVCDFDGSLLVVADEAELARQGIVGSSPDSKTASQRRKILRVVVAAIVTAALGASIYIGFRGRFFRAQTEGVNTATEPITPSPGATSDSIPVPVATLSPSPESTPLAANRPTPSSTAQPTRGAISRNPVSTGDDHSRPGVVRIQLTNGTTVVADEVWRTRQGVWYRRNGIVTLLKSDSVRSIDRASRNRR